MTRKAWSREELAALGVWVDLPTAAKVLGIGRTAAYALAKAGDFPVRILRVGRCYRIPTAGLMAALDMPLTPTSADTGSAPTKEEDLEEGGER
jgi:hypothetical protein